MFYFIKSENLGWSDRSYSTYDQALESARKAWKLDPARVGMCTVEYRLMEPCSDECGYCQEVHWFDTTTKYNDPMSAYNLGYCQCDNLACECDIAEMQAVYLDAIAH